MILHHDKNPPLIIVTAVLHVEIIGKLLDDPVDSMVTLAIVEPKYPIDDLSAHISVTQTARFDIKEPWGWCLTI